MIKLYSIDNERYFDDMQSALDFSDDVLTGIIDMYQGDPESFKFSDFVNPNFFEDIVQNSYDEVGEASEQWEESLTNEISEKFNKLVNEFAEKEGIAPNFQGVKNIKKIKVQIEGDKANVIYVERDEGFV